MKEYARGFYKSAQWKRASRLYMSSKNYVCERCGGVGSICHHKKYITPANVNDPNITLNLDNFECLCQECHNQEHSLKHNKAIFDEAGNVITAKDSGEAKEYKKALHCIDDVIAKARKAQERAESS